MKKVCLFLMLLACISCNKEDYYTAGELMGNNLTEIISENKVDRVEICNRDYFHVYSADPNKFEISGGLINVDGKWYNLEYVKKFEIEFYDYNEFSTDDRVPILVIYMDEIQS